jgi:hypothetical protein
LETFKMLGAPTVVSPVQFGKSIQVEQSRQFVIGLVGGRRCHFCPQSYSASFPSVDGFGRGFGFGNGVEGLTSAGRAECFLWGVTSRLAALTAAFFVAGRFFFLTMVPA